MQTVWRPASSEYQFWGIDGHLIFDGVLLFVALVLIFLLAATSAR